MQNLIPEQPVNQNLQKFERQQNGPLESPDKRNTTHPVYLRQPKSFNTDFRYFDSPGIEVKDSHLIENQEIGELTFSYRTDRGITRNYKDNEDTPRYKLAVSKDRKKHFLIVSVNDGMGGHANGLEASARAAGTITDTFANFISQKTSFSEKDITHELTNAVRTANTEIINAAGNLGSTTTTAVIDLETYQVYVANVGDSRTYKYDETTKLEQVTEDHSNVAREVRAGNLPPDAVYTDPQRNRIYRSLGNDKRVEVDTYPLQLPPGGKLLLCSDGLWEMVRDPDIQTELERDNSPMEKTDMLVNVALQQGGLDNVTALVVERKKDAELHQDLEIIEQSNLQPGDELPVHPESPYKLGRYVGINPQTGKARIAWVKRRQEKLYTAKALAKINNAHVSDLHYGDTVNVVDSESGQIKDGWIIFGKAENGLISVRKYGVDIAEYSPQDMKIFQSGKPATSISEVQSIDDLKSMLFEMGGFFHNGEVYTAGDAIAAVTDARKHPEALADLPPEIAEKVLQLQQMESALAEIQETSGINELQGSGIKISQISATEQNNMFPKIDVHGEEWHDPERSWNENTGVRLTKEHLQQADLLPKHKIELNGLTVFLSDAYEVEDRAAFVGFVHEGDTYIARTFWLSQSQGIWRYLPGYSHADPIIGIPRFLKGHGEESIMLPIPLQYALNSVYQSQKIPKKINNPYFYFEGTAKSLTHDGTRTFNREVGENPVFLEGIFSSKEDKRNKLQPQEIHFAHPEKDSPNFDMMLMSWEQKTNLYGSIIVEIYPSKDGRLQYMICRDQQPDKTPRAWIAGIEDTSKKITSVALREEWINAGDLTTPAYEYFEQSSGYGNRNDTKGDYIDMFANYIQYMPIIQEYLQKKGYVNLESNILGNMQIKDIKNQSKSSIEIQIAKKLDFQESMWRRNVGDELVRSILIQMERLNIQRATLLQPNKVVNDVDDNWYFLMNPGAQEVPGFWIGYELPKSPFTENMGKTYFIAGTYTMLDEARKAGVKKIDFFVRRALLEQLKQLAIGASSSKEKMQAINREVISNIVGGIKRYLSEDERKIVDQYEFTLPERAIE